MTARLFSASLLVIVLMLALNGVSGAQEPGPDAPQTVQATLGTAFTYQGRLANGGAPADGPYDLRFRLFNSLTGGSQVGGTLILDDTQVNAGLFTVSLDFGNIFDGVALYLQIDVRPGASGGSYTTLTPRQPLTATPYSLYSKNAWSLTGNAGTSPGINFVGTTDGQSLIFKTNNTEAMRIDTAGNVSVGSPGTSAKFEASGLATGGIAVMGTSTTRAVIGRLGLGVSCPGTFGVGGCAGTTGGYGVFGSSDTGIGVYGTATTGRAVVGYSGTGIGILGDSTTRGIVGTLGRTSCAGTYAVGGCAGSTVAAGVYGYSESTVAIQAGSNGGDLFRGLSGTTRVARIDRTGKGFFNGGTQTGGADFAESMRATEDATPLEPGDVLEIDPDHGGAMRRSSGPASRLVAGVYSTQPSVLAVGTHGIDDKREGEVPVALLGVVPTKVSAENGPIAIGDLLVTASLPGHAMLARPEVVNGVGVYPTGAILGKALEPLAAGNGVIRVLVTLR